MGGGSSELDAMAAAYKALESLDETGRQRAMHWLSGALGIAPSAPTTKGSTARPGDTPQGNGAIAKNEDTGDIPRPKEFIVQKRPKNNAERIACLGFYLTHYRGMTSFSAREISTINTEAALSKMLNLSRDIDNTDRTSGYIVSAGSRLKQMTSRGEELVRALPNRDAVKLALESHPHRRRKASTGAKKSTPSGDIE
jgi:hypothetical protein